MAFLPFYFLAEPLVPSLLEVLIVLGNKGFGRWVCDGGEPAGLPVFLIPCLDPQRTLGGRPGSPEPTPAAAESAAGGSSSLRQCSGPN